MVVEAGHVGGGRGEALLLMQIGLAAVTSRRVGVEVSRVDGRVVEGGVEGVRVGVLVGRGVVVCSVKFRHARRADSSLLREGGVDFDGQVVLLCVLRRLFHEGHLGYALGVSERASAATDDA